MKKQVIDIFPPEMSNQALESVKKAQSAFNAVLKFIENTTLRHVCDEGKRELETAIAQLERQCWQPIETAPKGVGPIDLMVSFYGEWARFTDCIWDNGSHSWFCREKGRYLPYPPAYWMPKPPPPIAKPKEGWQYSNSL